MAGGEKLSKKKELAIAAILECKTLKEAAKKVGVSDPTLWRWMQIPKFQAALKEAKKQCVEGAVSKLSQICDEAVKNLRDIMNNPEVPASARVSAAKCVLDSGLKGVELDDLEARLAALERELTDEKGVIKSAY